MKNYLLKGIIMTKEDRQIMYHNYLREYAIKMGHLSRLTTPDCAKTIHGVQRQLKKLEAKILEYTPEE